MPCRYDGPEVDHYAEYQKTHAQHEKVIKTMTAMLCGVLTSLEVDGGFDRIVTGCDYKEMGVTKKELLDWWHEHQEEDKARKKREEDTRIRKAAADREARRLEKVRLSALDKLSPEERRALGIK